MTEQQLSQFEAASGSPERADLWRNEVQDRLARYKRRRGRRIEGAYTMRFPFPADEETEGGPSAEVAATVAELQEVSPEPDSPAEETIEYTGVPEPGVRVSAELVAELAAQTPEATPEAVDLIVVPPLVLEEEPASFVDVVPRPRPKRKVIAFPRQLSVAPEAAYRLADPVTAEVPRILDVPEELEATPFLDGLQLDVPSDRHIESDREHVDLPFRAARIPRRLLAGTVDFAVTGIGVAVFAAAAYKTLADPPIAKPLVLGIAAAAVVLWSVYQYLFVLYAGKTLGMMAAHIRLRTFQGTTPRLQQRRNRVLGFYLSALSLGMGLMWALVDVDGLCWHDRLSQTYLSGHE